MLGTVRWFAAFHAPLRLIPLVTNLGTFTLQVNTPPQPALSCLPAGYTPVMERLKGQVESYGGFLRLMRRPNTTMAPSTSPTKDLIEPKSTNPSSGPPSEPCVHSEHKEVSCSSSCKEKGEKGLVGVLKHGKAKMTGEKKVRSLLFQVLVLCRF